MSEATKLDIGQRHILKLVAKDADLHGWAPVSALVFPLLKGMPAVLLEIEPVGDDGCGRVRLTPKGQSILDAMEWL